MIFLESKNKESVFKELIGRLDEEHKLNSLSTCIEDVLAREAVVTTCMPGGIALPHGRTDGAKELVSIIGISKEGVMCDAPDGMPTHIFVLSICPKDAHAPYLMYMAMIAKTLDRKDAVKEICNMKNTSQIRDTFLKSKGKQ